MPEISQHRLFPLSAVPQWDFECDVVVIGFGAAGACAAIEAAGAGAKVILFERNSGSGGASGLSSGEIYIGGSGGSDAQRAAGFEDSTENMIAYLKAAAGPAVDDAKCELYAQQSLEHYAWLKAQGVPYRGNYLPGKYTEPADDSTLVFSGSEVAFHKIAEPVPRGHVVQHMGADGGRLLVDVLDRKVRELGVDVITDARARALIGDGARIVGAVVRIDNVDRFVRARNGVVLATGGFAFNERMRRKYCPQTLRLDTPLGDKDDGIGIELGAAAGGDPINMEQFLVTTAWIVPQEHAHGVFVNVAGQRFVNEDAYHGRVSRFAFDQPEGKVYLLLDMPHFSQPLEMARIEIAGTGDTWEEVEAELGMAEGTLSATMAFYNRHAREGNDPLYGKIPPTLTPLDQGPFVALELNFSHTVFPFFTLGGLATSVDGEVLDRGGTPIPGLFAAGRCTSGLNAWGYGYSSGMSLGDCTFFGRRAGKKAAQG